MTLGTGVDVDRWCAVIRDAFLEQPGLRLTLPQTQRLWGLGRQVCERALYALVCEGFLIRTVDGQFCRPDYTTVDD